MTLEEKYQKLLKLARWGAKKPCIRDSACLSCYAITVLRAIDEGINDMDSKFWQGSFCTIANCTRTDRHLHLVE